MTAAETKDASLMSRSTEIELLAWAIFRCTREKCDRCPGLAVAPGFINMLSWSNESLIQDGRSQGEIRQGVTTEIMGEGESMGPLNERMKKRILRSSRRTSNTRLSGTRFPNTCATCNREVFPAMSLHFSEPPPFANTSLAWKTNSRHRSSSIKCGSWCARKWKPARSVSAHR